MIRSADFVGIDDICRRTFATQNFLLGRIFANITTLSNGSVAEWLNAPVLKTGDG